MTVSRDHKLDQAMNWFQKIWASFRNTNKCHLQKTEKHGCTREKSSFTDSIKTARLDKKFEEF